MITKYIAFDGKFFSNENDCLEHDRILLETPICDLLNTTDSRMVEDIISAYMTEKGPVGVNVHIYILKNATGKFLKACIISENVSGDSTEPEDGKVALYNCVTKYYTMDNISIDEIPGLIKDQLYDSVPATVNVIRNEYSNTGDISDGYHTFNQLYYQRCVLFSMIVNSHPDISWKSRRHSDGELCFNGDYFIVGIDTPEGWFTYHYENKYWDMFKCVELNNARKWDGHTENDITRLFSIGKQDCVFDKERKIRKHA